MQAEPAPCCLESLNAFSAYFSSTQSAASAQTQKMHSMCNQPLYSSSATCLFVRISCMHLILAKFPCTSRFCSTRASSSCFFKCFTWLDKRSFTTSTFALCLRASSRSVFATLHAFVKAKIHQSRDNKPWVYLIFPHCA